jgi:hypothetical protein
MVDYLHSIGVALECFAEYAKQVTSMVCQSAVSIAQAAGQEVIWLPSSAVSKEKLAREVMAEKGVGPDGLICVFSTLELCRTFNVDRRGLLRPSGGKCKHYYFYFQHPEWGFMHVRLQTWLPLTMFVYLNGRHWLGQQMDRAGIAYQQRDNCFVWIEDVEAAQALLDAQTTSRWEPILNRLVQRVHPTHAKLFREQPDPYYWSMEQTEFATDVMFRSPEALAGIYPQLVQHAISQFGSRDVMQFLGRRMPTYSGVHRAFKGEVMTELRQRPEGIRIKHRVNGNHIKMYDKQGSVLRVETTINQPRDIKTFRRKEGAPRQEKKQWRPLRKGLADKGRRAEVCGASNGRYLVAHAAAKSAEPLGKLAAKVCRPTKIGERRVRAINPLSPDDGQLLSAIRRGEFLTTGFRNRDLRQLLYGAAPTDPKDQRRQAAAITRKLALLRAHGLIKKIPKSHRYQLTNDGNVIVTALLAAKHAKIHELTEIAA